MRELNSYGTSKGLPNYYNATSLALKPEYVETQFEFHEGKIIEFPKDRMKAYAVPEVRYSVKQQMVMTWWQSYSPYKDHYAIIADGAVRSGKTASMSLSFVIWAMSTYRNTKLAFCGKTIGSLKRNVMDPLKIMLRGNRYKVRERYGENMWEVTQKIGGRLITNQFYMFGGQDESSQDLIQGITLGGVLFDEVALMPTSFVNQATARCSLNGAKLWFNCNPEGPYHPFYKEWISQTGDKKALYLHFTMDDNPSLSPSTRERYRSMYSGIFKKRYIDGLWVMAEGIIYSMFDEDSHVIKAPTDIDFWDTFYVSCDYGTQNPCTFGLYGVKGDWVHEIKRYYWDGRSTGKQKTDGEYADDMVEWLGEYKNVVHEIIVDPSAASFIAELRKKQYKLPMVIKGNNDVLNGIRTVQNYLQFGLFTVDPSCKPSIIEYGMYAWDPKAAKSGVDSPIKENDHCMDSTRYLIYTKFGKNKVVQYSEDVYNKGKAQNPYKDILDRVRPNKGGVV